MRIHAASLVVFALCTLAAFADEPTKVKQDRTHFGVNFKGNAYAASGRTALLIGAMQENPVIARHLTLAFDSDNGVSPPRRRVSPSGR